MDYASVLKFVTLACLFGIGAWFATAQRKFDRDSRARPMLFLMLGLSLAVSALTLLIVIPAPVPLPRTVASLVMAGGSVLLINWAFASIKRKNLGLVFSGIVPGEVVQHGPYRHIRHPLYTAYSIFWASCAVLSGSLAVAALAACIVFLYYRAARSEERDLLASSLGATYQSYRARTGLMVPRLFR